jgi:hypothetical protein
MDSIYLTTVSMWVMSTYHRIRTFRKLQGRNEPALKLGSSGGHHVFHVPMLQTGDRGVPLASSTMVMLP